MKLFYTCFFLLFCFLFGCTVDQQVVLTLKQADKLLLSSKPDSAKVLLEQINTPEGLPASNYANWLLLYAEACDQLEEDVPIVPQMEKAENYYSKHGTTVEHAKSLLYLGRAYEEEKELDIGMEYYLQAANLAEGAGEYVLAGHICNRAAGLYDFEDYFDDAKRFYQKAADNFLLADDSLNYVYALRDIGSIVHKKEQMEEALIYYQKAFDLSIQIGDSSQLSSLSNRIGLIYQDIDSLGLAEQYFFQSIAYMERGSAPTYLALSDLYMIQGLYDKMDFYLHKASHSETTNKMIKGGVFYQHYLLEKRRQNHSKALDYYEQYVAFVDSLTDIQEYANVLKVEKRYDQSKLLNKNYVLQVKNQRILIACIILMLFCLLLILLYQYREALKNKRIVQQQQQLQTTHAVLLKQELSVKGLECDIQQIRENILRTSTVCKKILANSDDIDLAKKKPLTEKDWLALVEVIRVTYLLFFEKLQTTLSGLSEEEIRFCCLLKIGLTSQQLAILLNIQPTSISHKRYRIMKKGGFANTNTTLEEIIQKL